MIERRHPLFALGQGHTSFNHVSLVNTSTFFFFFEEENHDRTGKPVVCLQRGARPQQFIIGNDVLDRVNDQVRKRQKLSSMNVTEDGEKHSVIWRQTSVFMGKNYSDNWHSIKNTKDLTIEHMFDISAKLVSEQDEIYGVKTSEWENFHGCIRL